ncbi:MAG TPA: hypothetical protein VGC06_23040 [Actinomycetes bacterium]
MRMRRVALFSAVALGIALIGLGPANAGSTAARAPAKSGGLDCNGFSPLQGGLKIQTPAGARSYVACTEIAANDEHGFEDNGHYVGHDEADIGFFSHRHGSGNSASYNVKLPVDPPGSPSASFSGPTATFEIMVVPWFGMTLCDNESYPEGTKVCRPDSDSNIQVPPRPNHAGAAFMELQLYPPGINCSDTTWCAALTIDSLQAQFGALHGPGSPPNAIANPNCTEPVNFAFITHSGRPTGPPGPDSTAPIPVTGDVLSMNQGDSLTVSMHDTRAGFFTKIVDHTTGQKGVMTASIANGFRHILFDPVKLTCKGAPYAFHPMYDTAAPPLPGGQPTAWTTWAAHTDNIAHSAEIGHFEPGDNDFDDACTDPICFATDTDFDGFSYHPDWPNGSPRFPTAEYLSSPRSLGHSGRFNQPYPIARFETDLPRIEEADSGPNTCDHHTGQNCVNPPPGAAFYPWYHLALTRGLAGRGVRCAWTPSNDLPNQITNFGGERRAWGPLERTDYGFDKRFHNFARTIPNLCP